MKTRKIQVSLMLRDDQLRFLQRKLNKNNPKLASRSALIEQLIDKEMEKIEVFN